MPTPLQYSQLLLLVAVAAQHLMLDAAAQQEPITLPGCPEKCGDISIPFPFGLKAGCFRPGFEVTCNDSFNPPRAFLGSGSFQDMGEAYVSAIPDSMEPVLTNEWPWPVELMDISVARSEARAYGAVRSDCSTNKTDHSLKLQLTSLGAPFLVSVDRNVMVGVGWNVQALFAPTLLFTTGYTLSCHSQLTSENLNEAKNGSCSGLGCCTMDIMDGLSRSMCGVSFSIQSNILWQTNPCSYGMLVERSWYNFSTEDLYGHEVLSSKYARGVPVVLDFAIQNGPCPAEGQQPPQDYACVSGNSFCANVTNAFGDRYVCSCSEHYDGNPYISNGCQGSLGHTKTIMPAMGSLIKLFNMWEIQLLVLLSFTLQTFLFFGGSLRQRSTSMFPRLCIWAAYLGADFVALYTIGLVSRHDDTSVERHIPGETQALAFFWAPFLLVHLGGQDTITAFAMEDNNLWLRHLLNLVVQVILATYVFWKSIGTHSLELLVSGIFVFVVGIIKYWERTWTLNCGSFKSLESSDGHWYKEAELPVLDIEESVGDGYDDIVLIALRSMPNVHQIFSGRGLIPKSAIRAPESDAKKMIKMVSIVLNVMYADLYTKALVVRTRSGIILRCISQMSAVVAFALFHANDKQRYSKVDIAITYSLFIGGFFLELCAVFISMMSPWTWAWLKARKYDRLARLSWSIFSSGIGWPEEKQSGPKSMGQYMLLSWVTRSGQARTWNQRVMAMVKWFADLVRVERKKIFWISKLLDTEYVDVDKMFMECVAEEIKVLRTEFSSGSPREWPNVLGKVHPLLLVDFGLAIVALHGLTERYFLDVTDVEANASDMMEVCRKLSNYMMYLLVTHPSMLPLNLSVEALVESIQDRPEELLAEGPDLQPTKEVVQELVYMWARLLIYAAGKSRPEMHAAELSRGGELFTFVWLIMALQGLGDSRFRKIRITNSPDFPSVMKEICAFPDPQEASSSSKAE